MSGMKALNRFSLRYITRSQNWKFINNLLPKMNTPFTKNITKRKQNNSNIVTQVFFVFQRFINIYLNLNYFRHAESRERQNSTRF